MDLDFHPKTFNVCHYSARETQSSFLTVGCSEITGCCQEVGAERCSIVVTRGKLLLVDVTSMSRAYCSSGRRPPRVDSAPKVSVWGDEVSKAKDEDHDENGSPSEDHEDHGPSFPSRLNQHHATLGLAKPSPGVRAETTESSRVLRGGRQIFSTSLDQCRSLRFIPRSTPAQRELWS